MAAPLVTQSQLVQELVDETGFPSGQIRHTLQALEEVTCKHLEKGNRVKLANIVTVGVAIRKKSKKRMGRNPQTGEAVEIPAKPATTKLQARFLKAAKDSLPSVQKAKRALGQ